MILVGKSAMTLFQCFYGSEGLNSQHSKYTYLHKINTIINSAKIYIKITTAALFAISSRHYSTNRAPLSLSFDPAWLQVNKGFTKILKEWIRDKLASQSDVYFVTHLQVFDLIIE